MGSYYGIEINPIELSDSNRLSMTLKINFLKIIVEEGWTLFKIDGVMINLILNKICGNESKIPATQNTKDFILIDKKIM